MDDRALGQENQARLKPSEAGQPVADRDRGYIELVEENQASNRHRGLG